MPARQPRSRSVFALVAGWVCIAFAISALLALSLGVAPFDVLNSVLEARLHVSFGTATWISGGVLVTLAWVLGAKPGPATLLGPFVIGMLIDAFSVLLPERLPVPWLLLAPNLAVLYVGVCLVLLARLGAGPTEQLTVALVRRGIPLRPARWGIEALCALSGVLAPRAVGPATVVVVLVSGPAIAALLPRVARTTGLDPNL